MSCKCCRFILLLGLVTALLLSACGKVKPVEDNIQAPMNKLVSPVPELKSELKR